MAITQDRMLTILRAAKDMQSKLIALREFNLLAANRDWSVSDLVAMMHQQAMYCMPDPNHIAAIENEMAYYVRVKHYNNKRAARHRLSRGTERPGDHEFAAAYRQRKSAIVAGYLPPDPTDYTIPSRKNVELRRPTPEEIDRRLAQIMPSSSLPARNLTREEITIPAPTADSTEEWDIEGADDSNAKPTFGPEGVA